jgi:hypothetical protein
MPSSGMMMMDADANDTQMGFTPVSFTDMSMPVKAMTATAAVAGAPLIAAGMVAGAVGAAMMRGNASTSSSGSSSNMMPMIMPMGMSPSMMNDMIGADGKPMNTATMMAAMQKFRLHSHPSVPAAGMPVSPSSTSSVVSPRTASTMVTPSSSSAPVMGPTSSNVTTTTKNGGRVMPSIDLSSLPFGMRVNPMEIQWPHNMPGHPDYEDAQVSGTAPSLVAGVREQSMKEFGFNLTLTPHETSSAPAANVTSTPITGIRPRATPSSHESKVTAALLVNFLQQPFCLLPLSLLHSYLLIEIHV